MFILSFSIVWPLECDLQLPIQLFEVHRHVVTIILYIFIFFVSLVDACDAIMGWHFWLVVGSTMLPCGYALRTIAISKSMHYILLYF